MDTNLDITLAGQPILAKPKPEKAEPASGAEPATGRALWPTFMRRTLTEEALAKEALDRAAVTPRPTVR